VPSLFRGFDGRPGEGMISAENEGHFFGFEWKIGQWIEAKEYDQAKSKIEMRRRDVTFSRL
jgi:hypothetical protein